MSVRAARRLILSAFIPAVAGDDPENEVIAVRDMTFDELVMNLDAAGLDPKAAAYYLSLQKAGKASEQLALLSAKRESILENIHKEEKQICCLDYLVYRMRKDEENK